MTTPNQNQNQNNKAQAPQGPSNPSRTQDRKDDMHNTGAQARQAPTATAGKDANRDTQARKDDAGQQAKH